MPRNIISNKTPINFVINKKTYNVQKLDIPQDQTCGKNNFYVSKQYFIKEASLNNPQVCGTALNTVKFYTEYYKPGIYQVPKLLDYQIGNSKVKLLFENIGSGTLASYLKSHHMNSEEARATLKKVLEAIVPFEENDVKHGDIKLKNIIMKDDKAYIIDFDLLGHKQNYMKQLTAMIFDFEHAHRTKEISHSQQVTFSKDLSIYHSCCRDVVDAILKNEVSSVKEVLGLISDNT